MGGGGGDILDKTARAVIDPFLPESIKGAADKFMPEDIKHSDTGKALGILGGGAGIMAATQLQNYQGDTGGGSGEESGLDVPDVAGAAQKASTAVEDKRRAIARSRSIFTSPLGLGGIASLARKFLLGE